MGSHGVVLVPNGILPSVCVAYFMIDVNVRLERLLVVETLRTLETAELDEPVVSELVFVPSARKQKRFRARPEAERKIQVVACARAKSHVQIW